MRFLLGCLFKLVMFVVVASILTVVAVFAGYVGYEWLLTPASLTPHLIGLDVDKAIHRLQQEGFGVLRVEEKYDLMVPAGKVVDQRPMPGQPVRLGRLVLLSKSLGPPRMEVPDLRNQTLERAQALLEQRHLKVGVVSRVAHLDIPPGHVIAQSPWQRVPTIRGSEVNLLISSGVPEEYLAMPNILGMTLTEAKQVVTDHGLIIAQGFLYQQTTPEMENHLVNQDPPPGARIRLGGPVKFTIGTLSDHINHQALYIDVEYVIPPPRPPHRGFVEVQVLDTEGLRVVHRETHPNGVLLRWQQRVVGVAEVIIYQDGELIQQHTINRGDRS